MELNIDSCSVKQVFLKTRQNLWKIIEKESILKWMYSLEACSFTKNKLHHWCFSKILPRFAKTWYCFLKFTGYFFSRTPFNSCFWTCNFSQNVCFQVTVSVTFPLNLHFYVIWKPLSVLAPPHLLHPASLLN